MTLQSKRKEKSARKRYSAQRWIVDWCIEPATIPGHVGLSLFVAGKSDDCVCASATRHYVLQQDRIVDLIHELTDTLEHSNASRALEEQGLSISSRLPAEQPCNPDAIDKDSPELSSHFLLGAYGLVGN